MPTTPALELPYPSLTDTPDVPFWLQQLAERVEAALSGRPRCKLVAGASQSVPNNSTTKILFGSVEYDTDGMADLANSSIVIKTAGLYRVHGRITWASNSTGFRSALVGKGVDWIADDYRQAANGATTTIPVESEPIALQVGDVITLHGSQSSGGSLNSTQGNGRYAHLAVYWVGGQ